MVEKERAVREVGVKSNDGGNTKDCGHSTALVSQSASHF